MSAPMSANIQVSKNTFKFHIFGHISCLSTILCLILIPLNGNSSLDIVTNVLASTKVNSFLIVLFHVTFQVILRNVSSTDTTFRVNYKDWIRTIFYCVASVLVFHCIAVLFGAPFTEKTAETFHFAILLTCTTVIPSFIHLGASTESWTKVFALNSPEPGTESMVYVASICSCLGGWVGAFPIPLDWDRPWQLWPVSCVLGTLFGHCVGLMLNSIYICIQFYKTNKFKST